jgi:hypothetical protein
MIAQCHRHRAIPEAARHVFLLLSLVLLAASSAHGQIPGQAAAEKFLLNGVMIFEGGKGVAWVQEPAFTGNQVVALRPGESLGPYKLTRILEDRIELEGPAGTVVVPVYNATSGPVPAVAIGAQRTPAGVQPSPTVVGPSRTSQVESPATAAIERKLAREREREVRKEARAATKEQARARGRGGQRGSATASSGAAADSGPSGQVAASPGAGTTDGGYLPRGGFLSRP